MGRAESDVTGDHRGSHRGPDKARRWSVEALGRNIHRITITLDRVGDSHRSLLQSDIHFDHADCNRDALKRHWNEARRRDAPIFGNGDLFDCMQGAGDRRASKSSLRGEHKVDEYTDALIDTGFELVEPYADLIAVQGLGNHETGYVKYNGVNLIDNLIRRIREAGHKQAFAGRYSGWIIFRIKYAGTRVKPFKLYYHHGAGGAPAVTRGVIQTNRTAAYLADADIVWTAHSHDTWYLPIDRIRLNNSCTAVEHTRQLHLRGAGYKQEHEDGAGGFLVEKMVNPKPIGSAWWLEFTHADHDTVTMSAIEAT